jgi:hypothetical protein
MTKRQKKVRVSLRSAFWLIGRSAVVFVCVTTHRFSRSLIPWGRLLQRLMDRSKYTPIASAYLCEVMHKTFTSHINILRNLEQTVAIWKDCVSLKKKSGVEHVQNVFLALCPRWGGRFFFIYRRRETFHWRTQWGGGWLPGCSPPLQIEILKTHSVDTMISKVVLHLPFSLNWPLKSADN